VKQVKIRAAKLNDLKTIQDLNYELIIYENVHNPSVEYNANWPYEPAGKKYFKRVITDEDYGCCFVAELENEIVGYLSAMLKKGPDRDVVIIYLDTAIIVEKYRSQGIGRKLAKKAIVWGKRKGANRAQLDVSASNDHSIKVYENGGFRPIKMIMERKI